MPHQTLRTLVALGALVVSGCAYHAPDAPTTITVTKAAGVPATLQLSGVSGLGAASGTATISAVVSDAFATPVAGATVSFTALAGTLSPDAVVTNDRGVAATTLTAPAGGVSITARVGALESKTLVAVQTVPVVATPPTNLPPPANPASPEALSVTLTASAVTLGTSTLFSANVKGGVPPFQTAWTAGDGTTFNGQSTTAAHAYAAVGTYQATVTVRDNAGRTASAAADAVVTAVPAAPPGPTPPGPALSVSVAAASSSVTVGSTITITATATASNGAAAATFYTFDCNNDGINDGTGASPFFLCTFSTIGVTTVKVTASNGTISGTGSTTVTVTQAPAPSYTVTLAASPTSVVVGGSAVLTASVSRNNGAVAPTSFAWDCESNGTIVTSSTNTQSCTFATPGTVTAKVTVTGGSAQASATTTVTVTASAAPVIAVNCATVAQGTPTNCFATATVNGSAATITGVTWNWGDSGPTSTTTDGHGVHTYAVALAAGYHVVATATVTGATQTGIGTATAIVQ